MRFSTKQCTSNWATKPENNEPDRRFMKYLSNMFTFREPGELQVFTYHKIVLTKPYSPQDCSCGKPHRSTKPSIFHFYPILINLAKYLSKSNFDSLKLALENDYFWRKVCINLPVRDSALVYTFPSSLYSKQ